MKTSRFNNIDNESVLENMELDKDQQKHLNYPLEQVIVRSNLDSSSNKKTPIVYLRYCVELILGEIGGTGNIMPMYKYLKYVKDLPKVRKPKKIK